MEKKIIEELFEKRMETTEKINKELDRKLSKLAISQKEDEIVQLFKKQTIKKICFFIIVMQKKKNQHCLMNIITS